MPKTKLGQRLKQLRVSHSYTQDYVASVLGVIRQTYSHYETGRCIPPTPALYKLAGLYDISVEDLLHLSIELDKEDYYDAPKQTDSSKDLDGYLDYYTDNINRKKYHFMSESEKKLLYFFNMLDEDDKQEMIAFCQIKSRKYR